MDYETQYCPQCQGPHIVPKNTPPFQCEWHLNSYGKRIPMICRSSKTTRCTGQLLGTTTAQLNLL